MLFEWITHPIKQENGFILRVKFAFPQGVSYHGMLTKFRNNIIAVNLTLPFYEGS